MKKDFVLYPEALALKGLGFDEPCLVYYLENSIELELGEGYNLVTREYQRNVMTYSLHNSNFEYGTNKPDWSYKLVTSPTYSQAFRWFREKHGFHGSINQSHGVVGMYNWDIIDKHLNCIGQYPFYSFEEAETACLKKLIELVKSKSDE